MSRAPLLIHLHIPKNAGTTLSRMVKIGLLLRPPTNLLREQSTLGMYSTPGTDARVEAIARLPERRRARVRFFEAHCGWGVHERLPRECAYFTLLREPNKRTLSVFGFEGEGARHPSMTLTRSWRASRTTGVVGQRAGAVPGGCRACLHGRSPVHAGDAGGGEYVSRRVPARRAGGAA